MVERAECGSRQLREQLLQVIEDEFGVPKDKIYDESNFMCDLGLDSLDLAQLQLAIEQEFNIEVSDTDMKEVTTVGDALLFLKKVFEKK